MTAHASLRTLPLILLAALALHMGSLSATAQDTLDIRPLWQEGQSARYQLTQTQTTRVEMEGMDNQSAEQQTVTEFSGEITLRMIEAFEGGGGVVEKTIDDLQITVTGPEGESRTATADSADEMMEPLQQWLDAMVDRPLTYEVEADGEIASVAGFDAIQQQAGDMAPGLDERYFRNLGRDLVAISGAAADAAVGSQWTTVQTSDHQFGEVTADVTYEIVGAEEPAGVPTVTIQRSATLDLEPELPDIPADGPEVDFQLLEGDSSGFIMFDRSRQEVAGYYNQRNLAAEIRISLPQQQITRRVSESTDTQVLRIAEE